MAQIEPSQEPSVLPVNVRTASGGLDNAYLQHSLEREIQANLPVYRQLSSEFGFGFRFGDKTCFDHQSKEILIGVANLLGLGVTNINDFHFSVLHEIKHYQDLVRDPETYLRLIAKGTRADGLGKLYFGLYNCTEDITVNERNRHDSALFRGADGTGFSELIRESYRERLFKERNFGETDPVTNKPERLFCEQYAHYILNQGMSVADDISVSAEVRAVIDRPIDIYGKNYSLNDFIEAFLRPAPSSEKQTIGNSLKKRMEYVEEYLEPLFSELLELDIKREGRQQVQEHQGAMGAPKGSSADDFKGAVAHAKAIEAEANKTPAERNADKLKAQREELASKSGLTPEEAKDFIDRLHRLDPVIHDLREFWLSIPQMGTETEMIYEGPSKSGVRPKLPEIARQSVRISLGDPSVAIMEKQVEEESHFISPKRIRVRLVVDASGSMEEHMETVADLAVALGVSFQSANATASIQEIDFNCETQFITFAETAQQVIPLTATISMSDIMSAYKSFFDYQYETRDHLSYELILADLNPLERQLRQSGELFDLVLVVTDGEPAANGISNEDLKEKSIVGIRGLEQEGLIVRAFGIGEIPVFDEIWNTTTKMRGRQVATAKALLGVTQDLLAEEIKIRYPDVDN